MAESRCVDVIRKAMGDLGQIMLIQGKRILRGTTKEDINELRQLWEDLINTVHEIDAYCGPEASELINGLMKKADQLAKEYGFRARKTTARLLKKAYEAVEV